MEFQLHVARFATNPTMKIQKTTLAMAAKDGAAPAIPKYATIIAAVKKANAQLNIRPSRQCDATLRML